MTSQANPLAGLKPVVVERTDNHAIKVWLGIDVISREARDAALQYLEGELSSSSGTFRLVESTAGQPFALAGTTTEYTGNLRDVIATIIKPKYQYFGKVSLKTVRNEDRRKVGVQCTIELMGRYGLNEKLPVLDVPPAQALRLQHNGATVTFSLDKPGRSDKQLIRAAVKVAGAFGVYVGSPPHSIADSDQEAKLFPAFDYRG